MALRGASALTDAELLAICFGTGRQGLSAIDLGRELIQRYGSLRAISRCGMEELCQISGVGPAKAAQLAAVFEFGKRLAREQAIDLRIDSAEAVSEILGPEMRALSQESLRVVILNTRLRLVQVVEVTRGSVNEALAHPREILRPVISHAAYAFILVHNHPSGDPSPSQADCEATNQIRRACEFVDIRMLDHVILGAPAGDNARTYFSFREEGML